VTWAGLKRAFRAAYSDLLRHHTLLQAAGLSYYFVLSVFPGLIFLSAIMGLIPLPNLFGSTLGLMSKLLPPDTMHLVKSVLFDILAAHRKTWLSLGMLGTIWTTSSAFDAMIEALDVAYDVKDTRVFWKARLIDIALAAIVGGLLLTALAVTMVGPHFGVWLASKVHLSQVFVQLWPAIHWTISIGFAVAAVELIYFLGPNVKQRLLATLPGAVLSVSCWIALSALLGFYFRHIANLAWTYGALAGFIAFMTWSYWNSVALLVGAELNAELAKESAKGQLPPKEGTIVEETSSRAA